MSSVVLATAGYDQTIKFWEATSGICYRTIQAVGHTNKLEITSDKKFLAAAGNPSIRLFEVQSTNNQPVVQYENHTNNVTAVGFQKENKWMFSGSEDGKIKIWDLRTSRCQRDMNCKAPVNTVVLHSNEGELISGDQSGVIKVWDVTSGRYTCELVPEVGAPLRSMAVAMDGSLLVAANSNGICYVWRMCGGSSNPQRFEPLYKLVAHPGHHILKALISPDVHHLATASSDKTVKLWNLDGSFKCDCVLKGHSRWVWDCVFSVDAAYLVTSSSDCTARLWDLADGVEQERRTIRTYNGHQKALTCCALNDSALSDAEY
ncbi:hypothetical protein BSKO_00836 [Bryopsis sp. KO-2023]|nr:hypothetical protein BSKO_00836 [Bryopsis sp. KO-2023]